MTKLKEYFGTIIAFAMVIGIVAGGLAYFAKAADLELVQLRLDQKIVSDQMYDTDKQIWILEERNRAYADCRQWPDERDREQYRKLKAQQEELQKKQDRLLKK
jgi:membrane peptidoglycan carboxypeptidase